MIQLKKHMAKGHSVPVSSWKFQVADKNKDISPKHGYCCSVLKMSRAGRHSLMDSLAGPLVFLNDTATPQLLETGQKQRPDRQRQLPALSTLLTGGGSLCPRRNEQQTKNIQCREKGWKCWPNKSQISIGRRREVSPEKWRSDLNEHTVYVCSPYMQVPPTHVIYTHIHN